MPRRTKAPSRRPCCPAPRLPSCLAPRQLRQPSATLFRRAWWIRSAVSSRPLGIASVESERVVADDAGFTPAVTRRPFSAMVRPAPRARRSSKMPRPGSRFPTGGFGRHLADSPASRRSGATIEMRRFPRPQTAVRICTASGARLRYPGRAPVWPGSRRMAGRLRSGSQENEDAECSSVAAFRFLVFIYCIFDLFQLFLDRWLVENAEWIIIRCIPFVLHFRHGICKHLNFLGKIPKYIPILARSRYNFLHPPMFQSAINSFPCRSGACRMGRIRQEVGRIFCQRVEHGVVQRTHRPPKIGVKRAVGVVIDEDFGCCQKINRLHIVYPCFLTDKYFSSDSFGK